MKPSLKKIKDYELQEEITHFGNLTIYKAENKKTNEKVLIKIAQRDPEKKNFHSEEEKDLLNEIRFLSSLDHINIIRYIESFTDSKNHLIW